jgi:hypothetical protein
MDAFQERRQSVLRALTFFSCRVLSGFPRSALTQALRFFGVLQIGQQLLIAELEWLGIPQSP